MDPGSDHSLSSTKTIYLIRHGVAQHNVPDTQTGQKPNLLDPKFTDPSLIRQGEMQASVLGKQFLKGGMIATKYCENSMDIDIDIDGGEGQHNKQIDLVVCSPLTRCLQTSSHIFPSHFSGNSNSTTEQSQSTSNSHFVLDRSCKVFCHADCREAYGIHYPDKRIPLSQIKEKFPTVTFHPSITENDTDWQPDTRETAHDVTRRIHNFFIWLMQQPHNNIAIVSHGVWIECALLKYCPEVLDNGKNRVYNCDVYCGKLNISSSSLPTLSDMKQLLFYHA